MSFKIIIVIKLRVWKRTTPHIRWLILMMLF